MMVAMESNRCATAAARQVAENAALTRSQTDENVAVRPRMNIAALPDGACSVSCTEETTLRQALPPWRLRDSSF
jgi:hypothetical protein